MPRPPWKFPLWSTITAPMGALYARVVAFRRQRYGRRPELSQRFEVPVISVGNLVVGGSGKTPFVSMLLERMPTQLRPTLVLGRGYGARIAEDVSALDEEGAMLAARHADAIVAQGADRVAAAAAVEADYRSIILDDGAQHLRIARDLDILLLDAGDLARPRFVLPAGPWREDLDAAEAADLLVLTRTDEVDRRDLERARKILAGRFPGKPLLECRHAPRALLGADGGEQPLEDLRERAVLAISGIARPESFVRALEACGARIVERLDFRDHEPYGSRSLRRIEAALRRHPEALALTTEKDLAKLAAALGVDDRARLRALAIELEFPGGLAALDEHLAALGDAG